MCSFAINMRLWKWSTRLIIYLHQWKFVRSCFYLHGAVCEKVDVGSHYLNFESHTLLICVESMLMVVGLHQHHLLSIEMYISYQFSEAKLHILSTWKAHMPISQQLCLRWHHWLTHLIYKLIEQFVWDTIWSGLCKSITLISRLLDCVSTDTC